ncbi:MAG: hypothetical protein U0V04_12990 [Spirosomataceae bacterium]|jgi:hypothetical protein
MIFLKDKTGSLGNNLFEFGTFLAKSLHDNQWLINFHFRNNRKYFNGTNHLANFKYKVFLGFGFNVINRLISFFILKIVKFQRLENYNSPFDLKSINFKNKNILKAGNWFTDFDTFYSNADQLRAFFSLTPASQAVVNNHIASISEPEALLVGVHIRRGDYKDFLGGQFYFEIDTYKKMMDQVLGIFPDKKLKFLISSDESFSTDDFSGFNTCFTPNHYVYDMYCLAACDYIIGPPSTYTMWASFYGKVPIQKIRTQDQILSEKGFALDFGY